MPSRTGHRLEPLFILQHGWGFSDRCWQDWTKGKTSFILGDRGYWGPPTPISDNISPPGFVLVCHSLGLHFLSPRLVAQAGILVIISGFAHFHGASPAAGRFSRRHLQKMLTRISVDPLGLVRDFYRDCNYPVWPLAELDLDSGRLTQDLLLLDQHRLDRASFATLPPTLLLHGRDDRIVPPERAAELATTLGTNHLHIIDGAGHGLPFTHPKICLALIHEFLTKVLGGSQTTDRL